MKDPINDLSNSDIFLLVIIFLLSMGLVLDILFSIAGQR